MGHQIQPLVHGHRAATLVQRSARIALRRTPITTPLLRRVRQHHITAREDTDKPFQHLLRSLSLTAAAKTTMTFLTTTTIIPGAARFLLLWEPSIHTVHHQPHLPTATSEVATLIHALSNRSMRKPSFPPAMAPRLPTVFPTQ